MLVFGRIADVYGRKKTFIFGASFSTMLVLSQKASDKTLISFSTEISFFIFYFGKTSRLSQFSEVLKE